METLIEALRRIVGEPEFYKILNPNSTQYTWDYGAMFEYFAAVLILIVVVASVFKLLIKVFDR